MTRARPPLVGLFVGGRSSRMGRPKGRIRAPDGRLLLARLLDEVAQAGLEAVLVGESGPYSDLAPGLPRLPDVPGVEGPMGGLLALLVHADDRRVIALACDMPHIDAATLRDLVVTEPEAPILAAKASDDAPFEPFLARYDAARVLPRLRASAAAGERSLQRFFRENAARPFVPPTPGMLDDWDTPADVARGGGSFDDEPTKP